MSLWWVTAWVSWIPLDTPGYPWVPGCLAKPVDAIPWSKSYCLLPPAERQTGECHCGESLRPLHSTSGTTSSTTSSTCTTSRVQWMSFHQMPPLLVRQQASWDRSWRWSPHCGCPTNHRRISHCKAVSQTSDLELSHKSFGQLYSFSLFS